LIWAVSASIDAILSQPEPPKPEAYPSLSNERARIAGRNGHSRVHGGEKSSEEGEGQDYFAHV